MLAIFIKIQNSSNFLTPKNSTDMYEHKRSDM